MESNVSSDPNNRALFLLFSSSSSSFLLSLFNSSWRSGLSSPMLSWIQTRHTWLKKKSIWCQTKHIATSHTHHSYLQQLLGVLQEVQTVFDPASGNICPLLPELFPPLALRLTWIRKWDTRMWDYRKNRENERWGILDRYSLSLAASSEGTSPANPAITLAADRQCLPSMYWP